MVRQKVLEIFILKFRVVRSPFIHLIFFWNVCMCNWFTRFPSTGKYSASRTVHAQNVGVMRILRSHGIPDPFINPTKHFLVHVRSCHFRLTVWFADVFLLPLRENATPPGWLQGFVVRGIEVNTTSGGFFCEGKWVEGNTQVHPTWLYWGFRWWEWWLTRCEVFSWRPSRKLEEGIWLRNDVFGANLEGKEFKIYKIKFTEV